MKWILASERLGLFVRMDLPNREYFNPNFCKFNGKATSGYFRKDTETNKVVFIHLLITPGDFIGEAEQKDFHLIEWLDETPSPVTYDVKELIGQWEKRKRHFEVNKEDERCQFSLIQINDIIEQLRSLPPSPVSYPTKEELAVELIARYSGNSRGNPISKNAFIDCYNWIKERMSVSYDVKEVIEKLEIANRNVNIRVKAMVDKRMQEAGIFDTLIDHSNNYKKTKETFFDSFSDVELKDVLGFDIIEVVKSPPSQEDKAEGWVEAYKGSQPDDNEIVDTWNGKANRRAIFRNISDGIFERYVDKADQERLFILHYPDVTHYKKLSAPQQ